MHFTGPDLRMNILKPCIIQHALKSGGGSFLFEEIKLEAKPSTAKVSVNISDTTVSSDEKAIERVKKCLEKHIFSTLDCKIVLFDTTAFKNLCKTIIPSLNTCVKDGVCLYSDGHDFAPVYVIGEREKVCEFLKTIQYTDKEEASVMRISSDKWHILEGLNFKNYLKDINCNVYIRISGDEAFLFGLGGMREKACQGLNTFWEEIKGKTVDFEDSRFKMLLYEKEKDERNDNVLAYLRKQLQRSKGSYFYIFTDNHGNCYVYSREKEGLKMMCSQVRDLICIWSCDKLDAAYVDSQIKEELNHKHLKVVKEEFSSITYVCTRKALIHINQNLNLITETILLPSLVKTYLEGYSSDQLNVLEKACGVKTRFEPWQHSLCIEGPPSKQRVFMTALNNLYFSEKLTMTVDSFAVNTLDKILLSVAEKHQCCCSLQKQDQMFGSCKLVSAWQHSKHDGKLTLLTGDTEKLPDKYRITIGTLEVVFSSSEISPRKENGICKYH